MPAHSQFHSPTVRKAVRRPAVNPQTSHEPTRVNSTIVNKLVDALSDGERLQLHADLHDAGVIKTTDVTGMPRPEFKQFLAKYRV